MHGKAKLLGTDLHGGWQLTSEKCTSHLGGSLTLCPNHSSQLHIFHWESQEWSNRARHLSFTTNEKWLLDVATEYFVHDHLSAVATDIRMDRVIVVGGIVTIICKYLNIHIRHEEEVLWQTRLNMTYLNRTKHVKMAFDQWSGDLNYYIYLAHRYFILIHINHYAPTNPPNSHRKVEDNEEEDDIAPMIISSYNPDIIDKETSRRSERNNKSAAELHPTRHHIGRIWISQNAHSTAHGWSQTARTASVCHISIAFDEPASPP